MAEKGIALLEPAVLKAADKIMKEISRFHRGDRVYVVRALLGNAQFERLLSSAQAAGPYPRPLSPGGNADAE